MAPRRHRISIGGQRWTLEVGAVLPRDRWADCDPPTARRRLIRISNAATGATFLDCVIHELIHARWWALCESEVKEFAEELTAVLRLFSEQVIDAMEEDSDLPRSRKRKRRSAAPRRGSSGSQPKSRKNSAS